MTLYTFKNCIFGSKLNLIKFVELLCLFIFANQKIENNNQQEKIKIYG